MLSPEQLVYNGKTSDLKQALKERDIEYGNQSSFEALMSHAETMARVEIKNSIEEDRDSYGHAKLERKHGMRMKKTCLPLFFRNLHMYGHNFR